MLQEYHDTELDFEATEKANRKKFYERHGFKEQFKVEKDGDENKTEVKLQTDEQAIQPKDYDDVGAEQGKN